MQLRRTPGRQVTKIKLALCAQSISYEMQNSSPKTGMLLFCLHEKQESFLFLCKESDLNRPEKWKLGQERNIVPILRLGSFSTGSWKNLHNLIWEQAESEFRFSSNKQLLSQDCFSSFYNL